MQRLIHLTEIETGPDDDPSYPVGARFDSLTITLQDGTQLTSEPVHRFRGHGDNPMSSQELRDKFETCVLENIGAEQTSQLWEHLNKFEALPSARDLPTLNENATR
jgi:2-methylcitrate dehydratase PrpD